MTTPPPRHTIDASVAVQLFLREQQSDAVHELFALLADTADAEFFVPDLFYPECANVFWKCVRRGDIGEREAEANLAELMGLSLTMVASKELVPRAFRLALESRIAAYDATYVAVAEQVHAPLVTDDAPLLKARKGKEPAILTISEALARWGAGS